MKKAEEYLSTTNMGTTIHGKPSIKSWKQLTNLLESYHQSRLKQELIEFSEWLSDRRLALKHSSLTNLAEQYLKQKESKQEKE